MSRLSRTAAALAAAAMVLVVPAAARAADEPDLSSVRLEAGDLPAGSREVAEAELDAAGISSRQVGEGLSEAFDDASLEHYLVYTTPDRTDVFEVMLVGPLTATETKGLVSDLTDRRDQLAEALVPRFALFVDYGEPEVVGTADVGEASIGITYTVAVTSDLATAKNLVGLELREGLYRFVVGVRGDRLFLVGGLHAGTDAPDADVPGLARLIDRRLADALGMAVAGSGTFRPAGTFSPEVATHIPTVTQVSTEPAVVGTNLVLAAIAVLVLAVAMRLLNSTLARHEGALEAILAPARWLGRGWRAADDAVRRRTGRFGNVIRVGGVLLFYGVLFSFLEPGWNPFSTAGLVVLVVMTLAFGLVGTGDDLSEMASARRHGLAARLVVKPALVMMAVGSVVLTKIAGLVPGIMIGTPESFSMEGEFAERDEVRLARVGMGTTALVGLAAWGLAAPLDAALDDSGDGALAAVVALLVLVFAVAVENLFANLLGFPGSEGETLRRRYPTGWLLTMIGVTGLFFHTLINPNGEVGESLETTNVRVVLGTVAAFALATLVIWLVFRGRPETGEPVPIAAAHTDVVVPGAESVETEPVETEPAVEPVETERAPSLVGPAGLPPPHLDESPSTPSLEHPPEGWYLDPRHRHEGRYWDGREWTDWVADHGVMDREPVDR